MFLKVHFGNAFLADFSETVALLIFKHIMLAFQSHIILNYSVPLRLFAIVSHAVPLWVFMQVFWRQQYLFLLFIFKEIFTVPKHPRYK